MLYKTWQSSPKAALSLCPGERTASACKALSQAAPAEPLAPWLLTRLPFQSAFLHPVLLLIVLEVFRWTDELPKDSIGRGRLYVHSLAYHSGSYLLRPSLLSSRLP